MEKEKKSILVVEDDIFFSKFSRIFFESKGYGVDTAETGQVEAEYSNLALFELELPDMDGTKLLTQLHKTSPKMMKIVVTRYLSLENALSR